MRKLSFLLVFLLLTAMEVLAQRTITGTVTSSADGLGVPGATVLVKGTNQGAITDMNGAYKLTVPANATTLVFSVIGMKKQEINIGSSNTIDVVMETDALNLDEVVVVGYGTSTKQSLVGTVTTIKNKDLQSKSVSSVSQSLAGEVAGVQVINTSGQPGSSATIRIRGLGSVNGNRDPLYVLDGVPFDGAINSINPNDIESTTILKDATATAIYGSRGANGVILLTTKAGKIGTSSIEVDVKQGVNMSQLPRYSTIKSPEDYIGLAWESLYNYGVASGNSNPTSFADLNLFNSIPPPAPQPGIAPYYNMWNIATGADLIDPVTHKVRSGVTRKYTPENWEDYGFQNSQRTEANISMSGGNEKNKYFTSFGYLSDVGYVINSDFKRYNATINISHEVKSWLTTNAKMSYSGTETNNNGQEANSNSVFWFVDNLPPIYPLFLRNPDGTIVADPVYGGNQYDYGSNGRGFGALTNSIADAHLNRSRAKTNQLAANFGLNLRFYEGLTFETTLGAQYFAEKYNSLNNPFYGSAAGQGGSIYKQDHQILIYNFLNLLRYKKSFGKQNLEILAAHEANSNESKYFYANKSMAVVPDIDDLNNFIIVSSPPGSYTDNIRLESYFSQLNYNYNSKYYFTASVRRDGSSRFIGKNKWDNFGSVGLSWILTKESFMQNLSFVDFLKFKVSYGIMGEQSGVGLYPGFNTFSVSNLNDQISISPRDIGNPALTWETSKMFQTGIEFSLGEYIDATLDYYIKNTKNLLFDKRVGPSVGYALLTVNDGVLRNSGIEFDVTAHILKGDNYGLNFTVNGEFLRNELQDMPIETMTGKQKLLDIQGMYGRSQGHSLYDFYTREYAGVDPADGTAMWYQNYHDLNGNGIYDAGTLVNGVLVGAEGIASLYEYQVANPDSSISVTTTKTYANATQKFVGKSAIPFIRGAFRIEGNYKNFDISAQFLYSLGGYAYDGAYATLMGNGQIGGNNWSTDILDRWQKPGDITNVPRLTNGLEQTVNSGSTRFITSSNFLAFNNIRIGYTFPGKLVKRFGMSNLNIFVAGDNLMLLSARDGFNPSTNEIGASDMYRYSPLTTYTAGLRVKF
ncbi:MAG: SusC/RagA family TonB-linked outer membrane protein [Lentimicrobiaceae bacterium]|jgi:TonB-linked SusC/RagA family outer membrane protein